MMAAVAKNAAIEINTINALTTVRAMTALTQRIRTVAVMSALFQNVPPRKSIVSFALFGSGVFGFGLPRALLSLKLSHSTLYSASASQTKSAQQVSEKKRVLFCISFNRARSRLFLSNFRLYFI